METNITGGNLFSTLAKRGRHDNFIKNINVLELSNFSAVYVI